MIYRLCCLLLLATNVFAATKEIETDLLIAGATESGWAAAIQAARLGVESITIVHDGEWYGGQYTEQALACVDENKGMDNVGWGVDWHPMKRAFHRSGLFKELMDGIEALNQEKYGSAMPGKPWHGPSTFRPAEAESIFRQMIQPWIDSGQIQVIWNHYPVDARVFQGNLNRVSFAELNSEQPVLHVSAKLTIDATDWGEVIQVAGAAYECGPDPRYRYGEPSAPRVGTFPANEMNPITWAMIVAESDGETPIAKPDRFNDRNYPRATGFSQKAFRDLQWDVNNPGLGSIPHWPSAGEASKRQLTVYSVRRIVDGYSSLDGKTSILLNYMNGQDYPLERLPQNVVDALEATEPGAGTKNIVEMTRAQRAIVFEDAKQHSLGVLYHMQNFVHNAADDRTNSFRNFHLSEEFGTPDNLPPKPYIRESLRLKAMYMMREQDGRNRDAETKTRAKPRFTDVPYPDGLFAWQFHYDFHRTGRTYLKDQGASGPWIDYHKTNRHTKFISDRCTFPLRSLVPEKMDGLLGAQGNVGFSSIVSAAIRLHDQRVHIGQAAGATAAICLRDDVKPRQIPYSRRLLEAVRHALCGEANTAVPLLLWGFRDLPADHPSFVAINRLAALGVLPIESRDVDFQPDAPATKDWAEQVVERSHSSSHPFGANLGTRGEFCEKWWAHRYGSGDWTGHEFIAHNNYDADVDGIPDHEDALLFTPNAPIRFEIHRAKLTPQTDGIPPQSADDANARLINFSGEKGTGDQGAAFDAKRGYGWDSDLRQNHRQRSQLDGPRDSFIFTRTKNTWEYTLPNGEYRVTICLGDSGHEQLEQLAIIEGATVVDHVTTADGQFIERTSDVSVQDGRLTVKLGSGLPESNTCINWILIQPATK